MKSKIAIIADTQLYKRLYGKEETRRDWYKAFYRAFDTVLEHRDEIAAVLLLGDIMDANEVGASAAFTLQSCLKNFSEQCDIPIGMILGNHDNERNSENTWVEVCQLVAPKLARLRPDSPLEIPVNGKTIYIYGIDNGSRERIAEELKLLKKKEDENVEHWLCLHQALKELAPHKFAWDVTTAQIPDWIDRVFLGDFHNMAKYTDTRGREFIYPGAIETVDFNQKETPGFIIFDTETATYSHYSTKQRDYITYEIETPDSEKIFSELAEIITRSTEKYHEKPVVRVLYTQENYNEYLKVCDKLAGLALRLFAMEKSAATEITSVYMGNVAESGMPQTKEGILQIMPDILTGLGVDAGISEDLQMLLDKPETIGGIKARKFPEAVYKQNNE